MFSKRLLAGFLFVVLLAGCQTEPDAAVSLPIEIPGKPVVWRVQVSDAAANISEVFPQCQDAIPGVSLLVSDRSGLTDTEVDFVIASESSISEETETIRFGETALIVINHPDNPFDEITFLDLQKIFSGEISNWNDLSLFSSYWGEVQRIAYLENSDFSQVIEQSLDEPVTGKFMLAANPEAVVKAVSEDIDAIGIVPAWALNSTVKSMRVNESNLNYQVVASVSNPSEQAQNWLRCLAEKIETTD